MLMNDNLNLRNFGVQHFIQHSTIHICSLKTKPEELFGNIKISVTFFFKKIVNFIVEIAEKGDNIPIA
jgi:hypothetical protein